MLLLQASKLDVHLPGTTHGASSLSSSPFSAPQQTVSSVVFEPHSRSLALMLSDSSFLIYPSFPSFPCSASCLSPPTFVPPISTSACFLRLVSKPRPGSYPGRILFVSISPHAAGSSVLLRAWILTNCSTSDAAFAPASLNFRREFGKSSLVLDLCHGISPRLVGSVNVFVLHSLAANQIWVLAAGLVEKDDGVRCQSVDVTKCAVVDCTLPVYCVQVSMAFLLLGEAGGVRVFPLRPLIKGCDGRRRMSGSKSVDASMISKNLPNGLFIPRSPAKSSLISTAAPKSRDSCGFGSYDGGEILAGRGGGGSVRSDISDPTIGES